MWVSAQARRMHVLGNRDLKQWLFLVETGDQETHAVFTSKNGKTVRHTIIGMDVKTQPDKLNLGWGRLK
jgi:site-specific recombinase XerC